MGKYMELKNVKIEDNFPLIIILSGKSIWKQNENNEIVIEHLVDRREDNYTITGISYVKLKPSVDKNKLISILQYFFSICDKSLSPQSMWMTNDCNYKSLLIEYKVDESKKKQFEDAFNELTKQFHELEQAENFLEEIPKGKKLLDVVAEIEVAYPETWTVDYIVE